jgi:hypothetical protein
MNSGMAMSTAMGELPPNLQQYFGGMGYPGLPQNQIQSGMPSTQQPFYGQPVMGGMMQAPSTYHAPGSAPVNQPGIW